MKRCLQSVQLGLLYEHAKAISLSRFKEDRVVVQAVLSALVWFQRGYDCFRSQFCFAVLCLRAVLRLHHDPSIYFEFPK